MLLVENIFKTASAFDIYWKKFVRQPFRHDIYWKIFSVLDALLENIFYFRSLRDF